MSKRTPIVVIDPGHGGSVKVGGSSANNATGANGLLEKECTLDVAKRVKELLKDGTKVILTRDADVNLSLADRAKVAKDNTANLFLSIHFNGFDDPSVDGTETYVSRSPNQPSRDFADTVQRELVAVTKVRDRGVKEKNFGVIIPSRHDPATGAALAEVAFLSNPDQAKRLESDDYLQQIAEALGRAIRAHLPAVVPAEQAFAAGSFGAPMGRTASVMAPRAQLLGGAGTAASPAVPQAEIPLEPDNGGLSIGPDALDIADIIVSTTDAFGSAAIRKLMGNTISHAALYVGDGMLVEAVEGGVELKTLEQALADDSLAVAFRHPSLSEEQRLKVRDFAGQKIGKKYDFVALVKHLTYRLDRATWCPRKEGAERLSCENWVGRINLGTRTNDKWFCSELVFAAFQHAGAPLTSQPPHWQAPQDIVELELAERLGYVGHLKTPMAAAKGLGWGLGWSLASQARFTLNASVGQAGKNQPDDVYKLKQRMIDLGFDWLTLDRKMDKATIDAIRLFQSIVKGFNRVKGDGRVDVPGPTYRWLQAVNAPRWQVMPAGSKDEGFFNYELSDTADKHDYGTDWLAGTVTDAGAAYKADWLASHPSAALLTLNDVSLPKGGDTPDHAGHESGLNGDLRLPRTDGTAPGATTFKSADYDRDAARAMLEALWAQPLSKKIFFNDPMLIGEKLCTKVSGHDDHIHFEIEPPAQGAVDMVEVEGAAPKPEETPSEGQSAMAAGIGGMGARRAFARATEGTVTLGYGVPGARITDPFYRDRDEKGRTGGRSRHFGMDVSLDNSAGGGADDPRRGLVVCAALRGGIPFAELNSVRAVDKANNPVTGLGIDGQGDAVLRDADVRIMKFKSQHTDQAYGAALRLDCHYDYVNGAGEADSFTLPLELLHLITDEFLPKDGKGNVIDAATWAATGKGIGFGPGIRNGAKLSFSQLTGDQPTVLGYQGATQFPHVHYQAGYPKGKRRRFDPAVMLEPSLTIAASAATQGLISASAQALPSWEEVVYDVKAGEEYGPIWDSYRPPGLPTAARSGSERGAAIPFIEQFSQAEGHGAAAYRESPNSKKSPGVLPRPKSH